MATFTYSTADSPRTRTFVHVVHKTSRVVDYIAKSDGQYEGSAEGSSVVPYILANRGDFRMNILSPGIFFLGRQHRIIWSEVLSLTNTMALSTPEDRLLSLSPFMALSTPYIRDWLKGFTLLFKPLYGFKYTLYTRLAKRIHSSL